MIFDVISEPFPLTGTPGTEFFTRPLETVISVPEMAGGKAFELDVVLSIGRGQDNERRAGCVEQYALERSEVEHLLSRQVDGLIMASSQGPEEDGLFRKIEARGTPYVLIDRRFSETKAAYVGADNREIGRLATGHLIGQGCRRIGHIAGPQKNIGIGRLEGYRAALADHDMPYREELVVDGTGDEGYAATRQLLALADRADGIFCFNDPYAVNTLKAAFEAGLRVPEDVKVIGAGNVHYSDVLRVPLSTIDQQSAQTGEQAAEILLGMIGPKKKKAPKIVRIKPELLVRESTRA